MTSDRGSGTGRGRPGCWPRTGGDMAFVSESGGYGTGTGAHASLRFLSTLERKWFLAYQPASPSVQWS